MVGGVEAMLRMRLCRRLREAEWESGNEARMRGRGEGIATMLRNDSGLERRRWGSKVESVACSWLCQLWRTSCRHRPLGSHGRSEQLELGNQKVCRHLRSGHEGV